VIRVRARLPWILGLGIVSIGRPATAQLVQVTVPTGVSFNVTDASASTHGTPATSQVTYALPTGFLPSQHLNVSVRADSSTFAGPGSVHIAASSASWTASASAGTASNGTLSSASYTQVYRSPASLTSLSSGSVSLTWTLGPIIAASLRSGTHTLTIRWKFEAL
jgi:hypothetical protein